MKLRYPSLLLLVKLFVVGALVAADPTVIPLWKDGAPGSEAKKDVPEQAKDYWVKSIHNPSLTVFLPPEGKANGTAVVIAPGGGHRELVFKAEGVEPAQYLTSLGVTCFVLKYRLFREEGSTYGPDVPAADIKRAMRTVRARASEWGVNPDRIGVMGWSAGGEVAAVVAYNPVPGDANAADPIERVSAKPNFQIIIYPGGFGTPTKLAPDTPEALFLTANDDDYPARTISLMLEKYRALGIPVEAHIFAAGGHGFNMGNRSKLLSLRGLANRMGDWLNDRGYLAAGSGPAVPVPAR